MSFASEKGKAAWTLTHNGWGDPDAFHVAVNTAQIAEGAVKVPSTKSRVR